MLRRKHREIELIVSCLGINLEDNRKKYINDLLSYPLNWDFITKQSVVNDIAPMLYCNLYKHEEIRENVPSSVIHNLKNYYNFTLSKNSLFWLEYSNVLENFRKFNLEMIPIKGLIFCKIIYGNFGLRPMFDVDVLIKEKNIKQTDFLLMQLGYKKEPQEYPEGYDKSSYYSKQLSSNLVLYIDVHWHISPPAFRSSQSFLLQKIWQRIEKIEIDGENIDILSPEDNLFTLFYQFKYHIPPKIKSICDVASLLELYKGRLDWGYLIQEMKLLKKEYMFYYAIFFAKKLFGISLPEGIEKRIAINPIRRKLINLYIDKRFVFRKINCIFFRVKRAIFLHLLLANNLEIIRYIVSMSLKEFHELYSLPIRSKKTKFLYFIRYFYIPFRKKQLCSLFNSY